MSGESSLLHRVGAGLQRGWERVQEGAEGMADAAAGALFDDAKVKDIKQNAGYVSIAATIIEVVAVAAAVFSLISGIASGGVIAGVIGFSVCALIAIVANDVRVIADRINKGSPAQFIRQFHPENPIESIVVAASQKGTFILKPDVVRWAFTPWHN